MNKKTINIIRIILMIIPSLLLLMSAGMKLSGAQEIADAFKNTAIPDSYMTLGLVELLSVVLFLIPKTHKIGFYLLCCYLGGAFATELLGGQAPVAAGLLVVTWISFYLGDKYRFLPAIKPG